MKGLARATTVYAAAVAASGIAIVTALEAWVRLQQPTEAGSLFRYLASEAAIAIAIPLLALAAVIVLHSGARTLAGSRAGPTPAQTRPVVEAAAGPETGPRRPEAGGSGEPDLGGP